MKLCWKQLIIVIKYTEKFMIKFKKYMLLFSILPLLNGCYTIGYIGGAATNRVLMIENEHNTIPNIQIPVNYSNLEHQQQLASK